jgi:hypothetical protein
MAKGAAWDSAYVSHEVEDHRQTIADVKAMQQDASKPSSCRVRWQAGQPAPSARKRLVTLSRRCSALSKPWMFLAERAQRVRDADTWPDGEAGGNRCRYRDGQHREN